MGRNKIENDGTVESADSPENYSLQDAAENSVQSGKGTIIIMDDDECIRDSLSEMLMALGYDVVHMEEGEQVVSFFREEQSAGHEISGIILDLIIPGGMGGKAAAAEIRKTDSDINVFAISGYSDDPVIQNPEEYGFTASLSKPFLMSELAVMLDKY